MSSADRSTRRVAVICITYRSTQVFGEFARAIAGSTGKHTIRLVVVDACSPDDTASFVSRKAPDADLCILDANRGYGAGVNAGIDHVRATGGADVYILANPDIVVDSSCIDVLATALDDPKTGVVCPRLLDDQGARQDSLRADVGPVAAWTTALFGGRLAERFGLPVEVVRDPAWYRYAHDVAWATGGLLAVSERCSDSVGAWAEHFFMYDEEVDFCSRARASGYRIRYEPDAVAHRRDSADRDASWRYALVRANRVRSMRGVARLSLGAAFVLGDCLRGWRAEARAGVRAVVTRSSPEAIMHRYLPNERVVVAHRGDAPTEARTIHYGVPRDIE